MAASARFSWRDRITPYNADVFSTWGAACKHTRSLPTLLAAPLCMRAAAGPSADPQGTRCIMNHTHLVHFLWALLSWEACIHPPTVDSLACRAVNIWQATPCVLSGATVKLSKAVCNLCGVHTVRGLAASLILLAAVTPGACHWGRHLEALSAFMQSALQFQRPQGALSLLYVCLCGLVSLNRRSVCLGCNPLHELPPLRAIIVLGTCNGMSASTQHKCMPTCWLYCK